MESMPFIHCELPRNARYEKEIFLEKYLLMIKELIAFKPVVRSSKSTGR